MAARHAAAFPFAGLRRHDSHLAFFKTRHHGSQIIPQLHGEVAAENLEADERIGIQRAEMVSFRVQPHAGIRIFVHLNKTHHGQSDLRSENPPADSIDDQLRQTTPALLVGGVQFLPTNGKNKRLPAARARFRSLEVRSSQKSQLRLARGIDKSPRPHGLRVAIQLHAFDECFGGIDRSQAGVQRDGEIFLPGTQFRAVTGIKWRRLENHVELSHAKRSGGGPGAEEALGEFRCQPAISGSRDQILADHIQAAQAVDEGVLGKTTNGRSVAEQQSFEAGSGSGDGGGESRRARAGDDHIVFGFDWGGFVGFQRGVGGCSGDGWVG